MYANILIPLDGSGLAEAALPHGAELAQKFGAKITLLRVIHPPSYFLTELGSGEDLAVMKKMHDNLKQESDLYLQTKVRELQRQGIEAGCCVLDGVQPAKTIVETANTLDADLIVMSTHGRSGIKRWFFGSVAEEVLRHADVPVLLVRVE